MRQFEMPRAYDYRNALTRRGTMTAEDPIITSTGSQCPSCLGLYLPSTVEIKATEIIDELFGDKSFVAGSCGIDWELQSQ